MLVAVASRHGSTREIGEAVAAGLRARGCEVDVLDVLDADAARCDVSAYDVAVIGSAVYTGHWLPAARSFVADNSTALAERPVWLFSSGLATQPAAAANSPHEVAAVAAGINARGHRSFRGKLDREVLSFAERAIIAGARGRDGDHRDFGAVAAWTATIADDLATRFSAV